jgi:hypothetical protein
MIAVAVGMKRQGIFHREMSPVAPKTCHGTSGTAHALDASGRKGAWKGARGEAPRKSRVRPACKRAVLHSGLPEVVLAGT